MYLATQRRQNGNNLIWFQDEAEELESSRNVYPSRIHHCRTRRLLKKPWSLQGKRDEHACTYRADMFSVLLTSRRLRQRQYIVSKTTSVRVHTVTLGLLQLGLSWVIGCCIGANSESYEHCGSSSGWSSHA